MMIDLFFAIEYLEYFTLYSPYKIPYCAKKNDVSIVNEWDMSLWVYDRWPLVNSPLGQLAAKILYLKGEI